MASQEDNALQHVAQPAVPYSVLQSPLDVVPAVLSQRAQEPVEQDPTEKVLGLKKLLDADALTKV
jgi:hypothetical protein